MANMTIKHIAVFAYRYAIKQNAMIIAVSMRADIPFSIFRLAQKD